MARFHRETKKKKQFEGAWQTYRQSQLLTIMTLRLGAEINSDVCVYYCSVWILLWGIKLNCTVVYLTVHALFVCCRLVACSACLMTRVNSRKAPINHFKINWLRTLPNDRSLRRRKDRVWSLWFSILLDRHVHCTLLLTLLLLCVSYCYILTGMCYSKALVLWYHSNSLISGPTLVLWYHSNSLISGPGTVLNISTPETSKLICILLVSMKQYLEECWHVLK